MSSTNVVQLTSTPKMTTTQVDETSVAVNNSPVQDYNYPNGHIPTYTGKVLLTYEKA